MNITIIGIKLYNICEQFYVKYTLSEIPDSYWIELFNTKFSDVNLIAGITQDELMIVQADNYTLLEVNLAHLSKNINEAILFANSEHTIRRYKDKLKNSLISFKKHPKL